MSRQSEDKRGGGGTVSLLDQPPYAGQSVFTVAEVAKIFRVSVFSIYQQVTTGEIEAIRFGKTIRIGRRTLAAMLEEVA